MAPCCAIGAFVQHALGGEQAQDPSERARPRADGISERVGVQRTSRQHIGDVQRCRDAHYLGDQVAVGRSSQRRRLRCARHDFAPAWQAAIRP
jgi:hypothetical protein